MRGFRILLAATLLASMPVTGGAAAGVSSGTGDDYVAGELIVGLRPGADPAAVASALSGRVDRALLGRNGFVLGIPGNPQAVAAVARALPGVSYAEPNWIRSLHDHETDLTKPSDTDFGIKWDLHNDGTLSVGSDSASHGADANWLTVFDQLKGASLSETIVAILDTGIDASHPDLNDRVVGGWDFISNDSVPQDGFGHGTHVAGIAAAETNNNLGTAGVGFHAALKIMPIKVCNDSGSCPSDAIANGITFAANNGAKVINLSLGGSSISTAEENAIDAAHAKGVLVVASAGNSNTSTQSYPAAYEPVMAIAATNWDDGRASYSNYGAGWVDLAAPGGQMSGYDDIRGIYSTMPTYNVYLTSCRAMGLLSPCYDQHYDQLQGTSMAAPQVTGAAGVLFAIGIADPTDVRNLLQQNANPISGTGNLWANGRLDLGAAVAAAGGVVPPPPPPEDDPPTVSVTSPTSGSTVSGTVTVQVDAADDNGVTQVEFFVGTTIIGTDTDGSNGWSTSWDTTLFADGSYTIAARATDTASQTTTSAGVTVTVDNPDPPPPDGTMHIAALSGISANNGSTWMANVTITIRDSSGQAVSGAAVTGSWSGGASGSTICTTDSTGTCTVSVSGIPKRNSSVTWTVSGVSHQDLEYDSGSNAANWISVSKP